MTTAGTVLSIPDASLGELLREARARGAASVEIRLPSQMPFVSVPDARRLLSEMELRCGSVACDARPNAPGRLAHALDTLRQATRAAAALGAAIVPFTVGAHPDRDAARATGLLARELKAVAALAAEVAVRLGIEVGHDAPGIDPGRTVTGALALIRAAGSPRALGLVLRGEDPAAEPERVVAHRVYRPDSAVQPAIPRLLTISIRPRSD